MDTPVIDFHCHVGRWARRGVYDDPATYLSIMDAAGIDRACINCIFRGDARRGNDTVARFVHQHPDRFIGVAFVTPHYPEEAIGELERTFDELGMKYIKIYPDYFGRPNDDPAYFPIYEWANDRGLAVMSHATYPFDSDTVTIPRRYAALSDRFPRVSWVLAHAGGGLRQGAVEAARSLPKVYLETAGSGSTLGAVEFSVNGAGADRVLYGSDMPLLDARQQIAKVATADISVEDKRKVLGLNAIRLLKLEDPAS